MNYSTDREIFICQLCVAFLIDTKLDFFQVEFIDHTNPYKICFIQLKSIKKEWLQVYLIHWQRLQVLSVPEIALSFHWRKTPKYSQWSGWWNVFPTMTKTMITRFFYHDWFSASFPPSSQFRNHLTLDQFNVAANTMWLQIQC